MVNQAAADGNGVRARAGAAVPGNQQAGAGTAVNGNDYNADKGKSGGPLSYLGAFHWIGAILYVSIIYAVCMKLDSRLPKPLTAEEAGDQNFSEERARKHLNAFADMGPRISGSEACEVHARNYIVTEVEKIRRRMDEKVYQMDLDIHKPSGCFGLIFLSNFTLCYKNLTNIVVRLGKRNADNRPSPHSLLLNCHFDSVAQSPGATDDAISCAIMLELLNVFSRQDPKILPYDLVFLFNGAEENFLQASHGFITTHPWRHNLRAFINLEGCGAGGREMLFQSGPANVWLMHTYLNSAPHPHCSIMAQEVFQSGLIPSDTDFRIFRDFGRMPGMDIAYTKNGYVYHTEFDRPEFIAPGALQRGGENILATAASIIRSPCFIKPCSQQETKLVYFDVVGQFIIQYPATLGTMVNYAVVVWILYRIYYQSRRSSLRNVQNDGYSVMEAVRALGIHLLTMLLMLMTAYAMTRLTLILGLTLSWYSWRPMVLVLYVIPPLIAGLMFHSLWSSFLTPRSPEAYAYISSFRLERANFETAMLIFAVALFVLTWKGLGSAYYAMIHALFPLLRDWLVWLHGLVFGNQRKSATILLFAHSIVLFPVVVLGSYAMLTMLEIFIPIMGRSGPVVNPELIIGALGATSSLVAVLYSGGMVYISRGFVDIMKFACLAVLFVVAIAAFTDFGAPYAYHPNEPRLRRLHIQHVTRTIYAPNGREKSSENALFLAGLDYRGSQDLPSAEFLRDTKPPPCIQEDAYCGLPYYVPVKDMFPPERPLWKLVANAPVLEQPIGIKLNSEEENKDGTVKMVFSLTGSDHMTVFITPLNKWTLDSWSLTDEIIDRGRARTYFVYFAYVGNGNGQWEFSLTFKKPSLQKTADTNESKLLLGVASHYLHGKYHQTPETEALIQTIRKRRSEPSTATLRHWKWAMTPDAFSSEYIAKYF